MINPENYLDKYSFIMNPCLSESLLEEEKRNELRILTKSFLFKKMKEMTLYEFWVKAASM